MTETIPVLLKVPTTDKRFHEAARIIKSTLKDEELKFNFKEVTLLEDDLLAIYSHIPRPVLVAQYAQFAGRKIGCFAVWGEDAVSKVAYLKGSDNDPLLCAITSWRYKLSWILGRRRVNLPAVNGDPQITMFDNYVHAPKGDEVVRDLEVFRKFFT